MPSDILTSGDGQTEQIPVQMSRGEQPEEDNFSCAAELIVDEDTKTFSIVPMTPFTLIMTETTDCSIERWESYIQVMRAWGICWEGLDGPMTMCHQPPSDLFADRSCPEPTTIIIDGETLFYQRHPDLDFAQSKEVPEYNNPNDPEVAGVQFKGACIAVIASMLFIVWLLHVAISQVHRSSRLRSYFRKGVRAKYTRLEWQCSCGETMSGDYKAKNEESLRNFELQLAKVWSSYLPPRQTALQEHSAPFKSASHDASRPTQKGVDMEVLNPDNLLSAGDSSSATSMHDAGLAHSNNTLHSDDVELQDGSDPTPRYFELCVSTSTLSITLAEITLNAAGGDAQTHIDTDAQLFAMIYKEYFRVRKFRRLAFLYKPINIQFVRFGVHAGGRVGIYEKPMSLPPEGSVAKGNYHYYECPLDPLPPIDHRTFLHYFWKHKAHVGCTSRLFLDRLPKKLNTSMHVNITPKSLNLGWGVHIIEGPDKQNISLCAFIIIVLSFIISLASSLAARMQESGFGIGQWVVGVGALGLSALYFQLAE